MNGMIERWFAAAILMGAPVLWAGSATAEPRVFGENQPFYYIQNETPGSGTGFVLDNTPPSVTSVRTVPENPGPADETLVEAEFKRDQRYTQSDPIAAFLVYSVNDGADWTKVEMDPAGSGGTWRTVLPPLERAGVIRYALMAEDASGNWLVEAPATRLDWGSLTPDDMPAAVEDRLDKSSAVRPDLDLREMRVAAGADRLFFALRVEGLIAGGSISPFDPYVYSVGLFYPNRLETNQGLSDAILAYAPHGRFAQISPTSLLDSRRNLSEVARSGAESRIQDGWLLLTCRLDALDEDEFHGRVRMTAGTAHGVEYYPMLFRPVDAGPFVDLVLKEREIRVETQLTMEPEREAAPQALAMFPQ